MALIMLIDDEEEAMKYYIKALELSEFDFIRFGDPDKVMDHVLDKSKQKPNLVILDLIMPPGKRYRGKAECEEGTRTGYLLYEELRTHYSNVPFIVLTNLKNAKNDFQQIAPHVQVYLKNDVPPFDLIRFIREKL
jgi:CheY-like chemotaxis protein